MHAELFFRFFFSIRQWKNFFDIDKCTNQRTTWMKKTLETNNRLNQGRPAFGFVRWRLYYEIIYLIFSRSWFEHFPVVHLLVMKMEVYWNESFDLMTSSTLISILNDDLFLLFDQNRWDGKRLHLEFVFFLVTFIISSRERVSEFIFVFDATSTQPNSICSAPDVSNDNWKNEQITSMLSVIDRIALNRKYVREFLFCPIFLFKTCVVNRHFSNFIRAK